MTKTYIEIRFQEEHQKNQEKLKEGQKKLEERKKRFQEMEVEEVQDIQSFHGGL